MKIDKSDFWHLLPTADCIKIYDNQNSESLVKIDNENFIHKISAILNPQLLSSLNNSNTYVATFSKEGLALLESGQAVLRADKSGETLATLFDTKSGKIIENARLENMLNPVSLTFSIWSVLSIITAQYYLHKVNYKLENIQKDIDYLKMLAETNIHSSIENENIEAQTILLDMKKFDNLYDLMKKYDLNSIKNSLKNNNFNINNLNRMIEIKIQNIVIDDKYFELSSEVLYLLRTMRILIFIQNLYLFLLQYVEDSSSEITTWTEKVNNYALLHLIKKFETHINTVGNKGILDKLDSARYNISLVLVDSILEEEGLCINNIYEKINYNASKINGRFKSNQFKKAQKILKDLQEKIDLFKNERNSNIIEQLNSIRQDFEIQEQAFFSIDDTKNDYKETKIVFGLTKDNKIDMGNLLIAV